MARQQRSTTFAQESTPPIARVALYARVSTLNNQDPEMQLAELREYAGRRGWQIVQEFTDQGVSGCRGSRPALNRLMSDACRRRFDAVLVWKIDRFGRSLNIWSTPWPSSQRLVLASKDEVGEDRPEGIFHARALPSAVWDRPWMQPIEHVILVHRLREVVAQLGFTRFEAAAPDIEGELDIGVRRASLAREISWLPAFENRGEGIFLQFSGRAISDWLLSPEVEARSIKLAAGFAEWKKEHVGSNREFPGAAYLMLHSFSHLLITALALSCGYPASSIRERVYAIPRVGYGILLYTGTSDSEGTLGGLVQVGRRIHETVKSALEIGALCSNDPVCAQHDPGSRHERRFLHGAACHGCLLISETSCEQQNDFLDRALVVPTVQDVGGQFFSEITQGEGSASVVSAN